LTREELDALARMNQALVHRGPDGEGGHHEDHVALAMRRLSIIDLETGWQPLFNEDRSLVIVANGEIYNYVELRKQLEGKGHKLTTSGDIETILHLYEEHGLDCVNHLRGMFAFALWDSNRRRLVIARDRMGEKPLYLAERDGKLLFASEMKAILRSGMIPFDLDPQAIDLYFHYQYVPEPMTAVKGVRKLDAAHLLVIDVESWRIADHCYWRMEDAPPLEGDPATLIREQLETVSELVIRSDVPVGVALSGGLDSSAIAALAQKKYPGIMHAFSVGYPGAPENDERADARALADELGMPFHDVELDTAAMVEFFPELVFMRDDPIADISGYGYYAVSKLARDHGVPVLLQGQGGDELFWGYDWVRQAASETAQKDFFLDAHRLVSLGYLLPRLPTGLSRVEISRWVRSAAGVRSGLQRYQRHSSGNRDQFVFYDLSIDFQMARKDARSFYSKSFREQLNGSTPESLFRFPRPWPNIDVTMTRLICDTYLRENGIAQGDRLSMASSVELRLPLVDYQLVEKIVGLRKAATDRDLPAKAWFKESLAGLLPGWVMNRRKRGFSPPTVEWQDELFRHYGPSIQNGYLTTSGVLASDCSELLSHGQTYPGEVTPVSFKALVLEQWAARMQYASTA